MVVGSLVRIAGIHHLLDNWCASFVVSVWKYCPGDTPKAVLNTAMKALGPE